MFQKTFEINGSCQIDGSGTFQASIIQDSQDGKFFYQCTDDSLITVIKQLYTLLMSSNIQDTICRQTVIKAQTHKGKQRVSLNLGIINIQIQTTKKPAVGWLLIRIPFQTNGVPLPGSNENSYNDSYDNQHEQSQIGITEVLN